MASQETLPAAPVSAQIIPHTIKLNQPPVYKGEMDYEVIEAWIYALDNYFQLTGLTDAFQQSRFAATLMQNQAALWLRSTNVDLNSCHWNSLKNKIRNYFRPADFARRARDELAELHQGTLRVPQYIDRFKRIVSKIADISDAECLDRFVRGLQPTTQRQILVEDPPTFARACQLAERLARLDAVVNQRLGNGNTSLGRSDPHSVGDTITSDVRMALLDIMQGRQPDKHYTGQRHYNNRGRGRHDTGTRRRCYVCGREGHMAQSCWHRATASNAQLRARGRNRGRGRYTTPRPQPRGQFQNVEAPLMQDASADYALGYTQEAQPHTTHHNHTETAHMTAREYDNYMAQQPYSWSPRATNWRFEKYNEWQNNHSGPPPKN